MDQLPSDAQLCGHCYLNPEDIVLSKQMPCFLELTSQLLSEAQSRKQPARGKVSVRL